MRRDSDGRLHKVIIVEGFEGYVIRYTTACSGCNEYSDGHHIAGPFGCDECGYHGKVRVEHWIPFDMTAFMAFEEKAWQASRKLTATV